MGEQATLGGYLRSLREERGASLEEMSLATRVSVGQLEALEADRTAVLPAPVFVKGFIRAYCQFLGQPDDEALERYRDLLGESRPAPRVIPQARPRIPVSLSPVLVSLVLLIVLGAGLVALKVGIKRRPEPAVVAVPPPVAKVEPPARLESPIKAEPATKAEPAAKGESAAKPEPVAKVEPAARVEPAERTTASPDAASAPSAATQRLTVKAIELTWLRVQADDGAAAEALLPPGTTREWTAAKRFLLTVGNAGGVELTLNGRPVPPLGAKGTVIRGLELPQAGTAAGS